MALKKKLNKPEIDRNDFRFVATVVKAEKFTWFQLSDVKSKQNSYPYNDKIDICVVHNTYHKSLGTIIADNLSIAEKLRSLPSSATKDEMSALIAQLQEITYTK